ncbi:integrase core domain-containing protein [Streptomyces tubercidicus]|uniref:integrase core domain-containing protein n=1 Tax=Streptomyces tubercidicus TaxID=47759 RepID=UPI002E0EBFA6|nr:integrase core domain-containing protein [Streptomyces tubercidicus]WSX23542.1 integrase core domain-containing protein [Streptomyces tubercidicus]
MGEHPGHGDGDPGRVVARRNADALLVVSFALTPAERARLDDLGMPLVFVSQHAQGRPSVYVDDADGALRGTRHLINSRTGGSLYCRHRTKRASPGAARTGSPDICAQYTSQQFASLTDQFGIRLSVGRTGQCWDNALAESFFATIKRELLGTAAWPSRAAARTAILDFIEGWYNLHRLHSSLGYRSPAEYETALAA